MSTRTKFCRFCGAEGSQKYGRDRQNRQRYQCPHCGKVFTNRTQTYRSGSQLSDAIWRRGIGLFCTRAGTSAADISRVLQVDYKAAKKMNRIFRQMVRSLVPNKLEGVTEWDETVITKQWVLGGVSRLFRKCLLQLVPNRSAQTLIPLVYAATPSGALRITDEWRGYLELQNHLTVCHAREFVSEHSPSIHTNTKEGIWGHVKPLSQHIYRGFPQSTLHEFLAEAMFRYNYPDYSQRVSLLTALLSRTTNSL